MQETKVTVMPNPNNGKFSIIGVAQNSTIRIVNSIGQLVFSEQMSDNRTIKEINLSDYRTGVYFITISSKNDSQTHQVLLN